MVISQELGAIEKVDLREIWSKEDKNFTPWLANNLDLLGDELGLDLELQTEEAPVGGFSLDLLVRETGTNRQVIIENQLEDTDHTHLGQLLTYASGYDGEIVVWIARKFKDEHRDALDWLNRRTGEDTEFFGVVVELLKIDDSLPAPHFDIVSAPNDWSKSTNNVGKDTVASEKMERYRAFFQPLLDTLREEYKFTRARKAQSQSWYSFSIGVGGFSCGASFASDNRARIDLYIYTGNVSKEENKRRFDVLKEQKSSIESELGESLEWERLEGKKACRIAAYRPGSIDDGDDVLEEVREWMIERLLAFRRIFVPRVEDLKNSS